MTTKTALRAEARRRRRGRRRDADPPPSGPSGSAPIPVHNLAEARGIAGRVLAFASSLGGITLPALFVSTPLEPDLSLTLPLFPRALLPVLVDEAGAGLAEPSWGIWEGGSLAHPPGMPPNPPRRPCPLRPSGTRISSSFPHSRSPSTGRGWARAGAGMTARSPTGRRQPRWPPWSSTTRSSPPGRSPGRYTTCVSTQSSRRHASSASHARSGGERRDGASDDAAT